MLALLTSSSEPCSPLRASLAHLFERKRGKATDTEGAQTALSFKSQHETFNFNVQPTEGKKNEKLLCLKI
jgi:hypothetical protein